MLLSRKYSNFVMKQKCISTSICMPNIKSLDGREMQFLVISWSFPILLHGARFCATERFQRGGSLLQCCALIGWLISQRPCDLYTTLNARILSSHTWLCYEAILGEQIMFYERFWVKAMKIWNLCNMCRGMCTWGQCLFGVFFHT